VHISAASQSGVKVKFEIAIIPRNLDHMTKGRFAQWSAAEIGVQNDAGGIDHRAKRVMPPQRELMGDGVGQLIDAPLQAGFCLLSGRDLEAKCGNRIAGRSHHGVVRMGVEKRLARRRQEQVIDRRKLTKEPASC
jgi:hypothetical protein